MHANQTTWAVRIGLAVISGLLMTATAFIIGVLPLVFASGAGAGARQSIGTTVFGGMVLASFVGIVFVPVLFVSFELLARWKPERPAFLKRRSVKLL